MTNVRALRPGHIVAIHPHHCRFGQTWQPICIEDDDKPCYVGPFVSRARAVDIAEEHRLKSLERWVPAW